MVGHLRKRLTAAVPARPRRILSTVLQPCSPGSVDHGVAFRLSSAPASHEAGSLARWRRMPPPRRGRWLARALSALGDRGFRLSHLLPTRGFGPCCTAAHPAGKCRCPADAVALCRALETLPGTCTEHLPVAPTARQPRQIPAIAGASVPGSANAGGPGRGLPATDATIEASALRARVQDPGVRTRLIGRAVKPDHAFRADPHEPPGARHGIPGAASDPAGKHPVPRLMLLAMLWGSNFLWIKIAIRGLSPVEVTFVRFILGALILLAIVLWRAEKLPRSPAVWGHITVAALFANAAPYLLFALGEQHVQSSIAAILNSTTPLWTVLVALAVRHGPPVHLPLLMGLIVGFSGALLIFSPWNAASGFISEGGIECLAAAISYGISYVYMDRFLVGRAISPLVLAACQLLASSALLSGALGVTGMRAAQLTVPVITSLAILGLAGTGLAYVLAYQIITREGATIASTVTYLNPVVAISLGALVLAEHITPQALAGVALILCGVALTRRRRPRGTGDETP